MLTNPVYSRYIPLCARHEIMTLTYNIALVLFLTAFTEDTSQMNFRNTGTSDIVKYIYLGIVGTVYHLVIYMQSNKIHKAF